LVIALGYQAEGQNEFNAEVRRLMEGNCRRTLGGNWVTRTCFWCLRLRDLHCLVCLESELFHELAGLAEVVSTTVVGFFGDMGRVLLPI
jgi:hypothetical protein